MTTAPAQGSAERLQELARQHLWMHFTNMGAYGPDNPVPVIERADGCHVWDVDGKRYLDGFSGLASVNIGYGRDDVVAAASQAKDLPYFPTWGYAHPAAIELAARVASVAPGDLNHVFFTSSGSEAVDSAMKLVRQFHKVTGNPDKTKVLSRETSYHGTTFGAMTMSRVERMRTPFMPLLPEGAAIPATNLYRMSEGASAADYAEAVGRTIEAEGPETVAAVLLEPVQNSGGSFPPPDGYFQRVREICDQHDVLLVADEVMTAWGRLGEYFGSQRYDIEPDLITTAKGLTSSYAPIGAVIASERVFEPFVTGAVFAHGCTFAGHPMACAVAMANLDVIERERLLENVRDMEPQFAASLRSLEDLPIVGDVRGAGFMYAIELVKDKASKEKFTPEEILEHLRGFLARDLVARGLICRVDDRGDPVVQLAPPLTAGQAEFDEIIACLRPALEATWARIDR